MAGHCWETEWSDPSRSSRIGAGTEVRTWRPWDGPFGMGEGDLGPHGGLLGAETEPHSGLLRGAARHCRARLQPPAPRGCLHTPSSYVLAEHRFKVAIQQSGCWLHKGAFITQLGSQPCSGSPWCMEVPEGGVYDPWASPGSRQAQGWYGGFWIIPQLIW